jgi:hypothetical protein
MADFYGIVTGDRGSASRLGHKTSGLKVLAKSYVGWVEVSMWHNHYTKEDMVEIVAEVDDSTSRVFYSGPVRLLATINPRRQRTLLK